MKVLITGSNGQVGHSLLRQLSLRDDIELFALNRNELDISSQTQVNEVISRLLPDVVINAAAYTAVDRAESDSEQCFAINRDGAKYLAQASESIGALLLHISTDYVFDGAKATPYIESDNTNPKTVYGQSKLAGEEAIAKHCQHYAVLRTAWVFAEHGNNFVKTMLKLAENHPELNIVADQHGGPTFAGDIAAALVIMMDTMLLQNKNLSGIYHFSGMPYTTWHDFADAIFNIAEVQRIIKRPVLNSITSAQYPTPAPRPANSRLNCQHIEQVFSIKPSNWKDALKLLLEPSQA
ncbi:dTDP-4-dehydrorhamnose reductase [Shewanella sp. 30m-9]